MPRQGEVQMPQGPADPLPQQVAPGVGAPLPQPAAEQGQLTAEQKLEVNKSYLLGTVVCRRGNILSRVFEFLYLSSSAKLS